MRHTVRALLVATFAFSSSVSAAEPAARVSFERDVRPIFKANCVHCHGESERLPGKLDLRLGRSILAGGKSGPSVHPGDVTKSLLVARVRSREMPPGDDRRKLTPDEIATLELWISSGAKIPASEPAVIRAGMMITNEDRAFWSFQPVRRPATPEVSHGDRVRTPIDSFILARLEKTERSFAPDADRPTLLRRAFLDLVGLPPTPEDVEAFLSDDSDDAYERLVDRLFATPEYGERWGRHWLDVSGYADSEGHTDADVVRTHAFKYRDYVLMSFAHDKPLDEFVREQLAGDEMVAPPFENLDADAIEKLVATGFLRMAPDGTAADRSVGARDRVINETIEIVTSSLLGLTVGCARCHHHRYDPIPQQDYYRVRAIFEPAFDPSSWRIPSQRKISLYTDADREASAKIEIEAKTVEAERLKRQTDFIDRTVKKQLEKIPAEIRDVVREARYTPPKKRTPAQQKLMREHPSVNVSAGSLYLYDTKAANTLKEMASKAAAIRGKKPREEFVRALTERPGKVPKTHLFHRGNVTDPRDEIDPGGLTILSHSTPQEIADDESLPTTGRRLSYAARLTDRSHPLTARVLVNRVWLHHFGRGLVATPDDFGALGERPTHPLLVDWLASELVDSGWGLKRLHKLIVTSTVYRQAAWSTSSLAASATDPDNRLYGGMPLRRLEAEIIRDSMLAVSGVLNRKRLGKPVPVMADRVGQFVVGIENLNAGRPGAVIAMNGEEHRRSVYLQVRRSRPLTVLSTFDAPRMEPNCPKRSSSTVAPQALFLLNSPLVVRHSQLFADRVRAEAGEDLERQIARAWLLAFARAPRDVEIAEAVALVEQQTRLFAAKKTNDDKTDARTHGLACLCQVLLISNEFLYVD
jgi:mono/diheme cytochrome c family protein